MTIQGKLLRNSKYSWPVVYVISCSEKTKELIKS